jgi:pimeloyl-ACP methyl ester carboxylesterase
MSPNEYIIGLTEKLLVRLSIIDFEGFKKRRNEMSQTTKAYLDMEDGNLYYEEAGEGMALVLSHAAFLDSRMFDAIWEPLAEHYRVIRYDMRGYGQSSPVNGPVCRRKDLKKLLDYLKVDRAHMVGCSNGGQNCLDLALEYPQLAASLSLVDSTPSGFTMAGAPPRYLFEMFDAVQNGDLERASELQIRIYLDSESRQPEEVDPGLRQKALAMNRIPINQNTFFLGDMQPVNPLDPPAITRLENVTCPTLIAAGSFDNPEVLRAADEMAARIPHARKHIFEGCGHVPTYEKPEDFTQVLMDFLAEIK